MALAPEEWMDLLTVRTTGSAREIVELANNLGIENVELAVRFVWDEFGREYRSHPEAAQNLLRQLQGFPLVVAKDAEALGKFARLCRQAAILFRTPFCSVCSGRSKEEI